MSSKENSRPKSFNNAEDEAKLGARCKLWNYPELPTNFHQSQNRTNCSPTDDIEKMEREIEFGLNYKTGQEILNSRKIQFLDNAESTHQTHEIDNVKLKNSELKYEHDKIGVKLTAGISPQVAFDEHAETDLDQPMDYALCYNETNLDDEKKRNTSYLHKNDFSCIEEVIDEEKAGIIKQKGAFNKEPTKNKKEIFSNTSRSFKEIFNFFKDRDKKRSATENAKSSAENQKPPKTIESCEQKFLKCSQLVCQPSEQCEKESKSKNEIQCTQPTPLMFSRCSSLGSLNGFEQNSMQDDRSSVVSDFSRRTSGIVSPSELPDSPAQTAPPGTKLQFKSQIGCFGKKKMFLPQEKSKNTTLCNDNSVQQESILRILPLAKRSVFEDNLTSFKDESTPTKLHSMAASSLSSLTIDDEDEYDIMNKIILNKEKLNVNNETINENNEQEAIMNTNLDDTLGKQEKTENSINDDDDDDDGDENLDDEKNDELTDLTPYEEQILDECIRRGIAKWTKRNINEIKPFSWDVGLTCLKTRMILNSRIRVNSYSEIDNDIKKLANHNINEMLENNNLKFEKNTQNEDKKLSNYVTYSNQGTSPTKHEMNVAETSDQFNENSCYITYEEHLLDKCIRQGMAKITKRHINDIKPFSWDTNQICLTTRAMVLHNRDERMCNYY